LLLIDLLVEALQLGSTEPFSLRFQNGLGASFLTINGLHPVDDVFYKFVHLSLIFENQVYFPCVQSQTDALP